MGGPSQGKGGPPKRACENLVPSEGSALEYCDSAENRPQTCCGAKGHPAEGTGERVLQVVSVSGVFHEFSVQAFFLVILGCVQLLNYYRAVNTERTEVLCA